MHDGMQYDRSKVKVKVTSPLKSEIRPFSTAISTDCYIRGQYLKLIGTGFLIFALLFVSRDFEVGSNDICDSRKKFLPSQ